MPSLSPLYVRCLYSKISANCLNKAISKRLIQNQCTECNLKMNSKIGGLAPALGTFGSDQDASDYTDEVSFKRLNMFKSDFDKYDWLMHLFDTNKTMFFRLVAKHVDQIMPLIYTPTVGLACENLGLVYNSGRGLFITIKDKGNIVSVLENWPHKDIRAICVTDGERILGLGDQGAFGMGIPVGKLALYTGLAGIHPQYLLPVCLDVGTNNQKHLNDSIYFGLKQKRVTSEEYDEFIDEFMRGCVHVFGQQVLIQFEDFANHNAFRLLQKYAKHYSTFNDDIQGTASVVLAALLASLKLTGRKLIDEKIVCYGAGEANLGFAHLVCLALTKRYGLTMEKARENIYLIDSKGLIVTGRKTGGLNNHKLEFARPSGTPELTSLEEIIKYSKCTSLIGAAAIPKVFDKKVLNLMAELNETPVIMALSNPTPMAECTAEEAYLHTHGRCVFASGSPFLPITLTPQQCPTLKESITRYPGQANNSYIFPSVALAIVSGQIFPVTNEDFLIAAETLANLATQTDYSIGRLFPPLTDIRHVSFKIAIEIVKNALKQERCLVFKSMNNEVNMSTIQDLVSSYSNYPPLN
ncbi:hypothetical protein MN116_008073 [Schistosoma mekongi]|uniref:Malic enzyme n=1 Tax=Schistosoma mekongi TaxID=38744 RepID=A0AAE2D1W5_SCHME|nr:hypothetical protein MN116_008073 [Schistosoma mekongi]